MARTKKDRLIQMAPNFCGFSPVGVAKSHESSVIINFEEYEALSLCDYELLTQAEAAELMNISRPTFTRIYESVRRKIAKAFVEGRSIHFDGGNVILADWYKCQGCNAVFTIVDDNQKFCPVCKSMNITRNT